MDFRSLFPSNYISAADLEGQDRVVVIARIVASEEVGQKKEKRPILYFAGIQKGLVLNKTNGKRIAKLHSNDTDSWIGKAVTLYPSECDFGDETVPCVRVRDSVPVVAPPTFTAPPQAAGSMTREQLEALLATMAK